MCSSDLVKIVGQSILSGFLGMALGMSLLLIALKYADAGIVATLSSTSPIMILYEIVVDKKYLDDEYVKLFEKEEAKLLPPWDPMGALAK